MYEALYRKYRPKTFDDVVGQEHITETLKNQVETGRLSHAYMFVGTRGTGKTTCARILSKAVNCEHPVKGNPCNECASCCGIEDGTILDVVELDAASNNGIDDVRLLRDEAVFSPVTVRKRVYIIDEVHMLSKPAFNALLKILEEPPEHLVFILATTEANKILPTILSRCQRHSFRRLDSETIARRLIYVALKEKIPLQPEAADLLGRLAEGGMRDGLSLLDQCSGEENIDMEAVLRCMGLAGIYQTQQMMDALMHRDVAKTLSLYQSLWEEGKDPSSVLGELSGLVRDALLIRLAPEGGRSLLSGNYGESYLLQLPIQDSALYFMLDKLVDSTTKMKNTRNPKLQAELCLIGLTGWPAENGKKNDSFFSEPSTDNTKKAVEQVPEKIREHSKQSGHTAEKRASGVENQLQVRYEEIDTSCNIPCRTECHSENEKWSSAAADVIGGLPIGVRAVLGDPELCTWTLIKNELALKVDPAFSVGTWNTPENIELIRRLASSALGESITIQVQTGNIAEKSPQDKLNELKKFENVTFK